jgi:hypothetical protein
MIPFAVISLATRRRAIDGSRSRHWNERVYRVTFAGRPPSTDCDCRTFQEAIGAVAATSARDAFPQSGDPIPDPAGIEIPGLVVRFPEPNLGIEVPPIAAPLAIVFRSRSAPLTGETTP